MPIVIDVTIVVTYQLLREIPQWLDALASVVTAVAAYKVAMSSVPKKTKKKAKKKPRP